uniref:(northern house mosquito) hypothetical protein n=1 Tax=Culex pipiens TaxID=7175 RepID=A0A8D8JM22_CULPI
MRPRLCSGFRTKTPPSRPNSARTSTPPSPWPASTKRSKTNWSLWKPNSSSSLTTRSACRPNIPATTPRPSPPSRKTSSRRGTCSRKSPPCATINCRPAATCSTF